ncbi:hypothetical protein [Pseudomonas putida]
MTVIHDQAMHFIYQQVLDRLLSQMTQAQRASLQLLIQRLLVAAGGPEYMGSFRLLVLHGSDRRSARLLAVLRAAQLSIALRAPMTFQLRVLVVCLPAPSTALLEDHDRIFSALFMQDDPRVDLQMLEGCETQTFSRRPSSQTERWGLARDALLMFGHLIDTRPEALLGSRLYLELADALSMTLAEAGADVLVTAMPIQHRRRYLAWARRCLRRAGVQGPHAVHHCMATLMKGLAQLHGVAGSPLEAVSTSAIGSLDEPLLRGMAIDDLIPHLLDEGPLDHMLGGCFDPALDSHPLGAFVDPQALGQLYELRARGVEAFIPREALKLASQRGVSIPREAQQTRFAKAYGLEPIQLSCLLFSPFARRGRGLERFLQSRHPDMLVASPYLHRALQGKPCPEAVRNWLLNTSGLSLGQLRGIYEGRLQWAAWRLLADLARRDVHLRWQPRPPAPGAAAIEAEP